MCDKYQSVIHQIPPCILQGIFNPIFQSPQRRNKNTWGRDNVSYYYYYYYYCLLKDKRCYLELRVEHLLLLGIVFSVRFFFRRRKVVFFKEFSNKLSGVRMSCVFVSYPKMIFIFAFCFFDSYYRYYFLPSFFFGLGVLLKDKKERIYTFY